MRSLPFFLSIALITLALSAPAGSQTTKPKQTTQIGTNQTADQAVRVAKEHRAQARSLLLSLASDARSFPNQTLRARTLARIADALWDSDIERGRELFRKAWEAAESADQETARQLQEEIRRQKAKTGGGYAMPSQPNLCGEVLRLAARRDRELGEAFLQSLKANERPPANGLDQRLSLAQDLLATGDSDRALQFAASELGTINMFTVDFLSYLREKNAAIADQRYGNMLAIAGRNTQADANTVSLLSSYIFTPHTYLTFHGGGMDISMMGSDDAPANVSPELQLAFFQTAAGVLLRAEAQPQTQTAGLEDKYLLMKRLMPLFEQHAPSELTNALRSRFEALGDMVSGGIRQQQNPDLAHQMASAQQTANREQAILEQIDHAKSSAERDRLYFQLAEGAMEMGDLRARDFVSKIDDSEFRKASQAYIDVSLAVHSIRSKKTELSLEMAQKGELSHIQRVWLLTQLAKLLAKPDRDKALSLLEDAVSEVRGIEGLDPNRPRALLAIANAQRLVEPPRALDSVFEAVKAANSADGFTGEDGALNIVFQTKGFSSANDNQEPDFDIKGIFAVLAQNDFDRAVELAHGFQGEAPRAAAVIAIARAVLEDKKAVAPSPKASPAKAK